MKKRLIALLVILLLVAGLVRAGYGYFGFVSQTIYDESTAHLTGSVGGGVGGVRLNQVDHGLRLRQVQLPIQKGPLGEFAPPGGSGTGQIQRVQPRGQHSGGAVAVEFHRVLTGIAVRAVGNHGAAGVDDAALLVMQLPQTQTPVGNTGQLFMTV